jgi:hypothetical protein
MYNRRLVQRGRHKYLDRCFLPSPLTGEGEGEGETRARPTYQATPSPPSQPSPTRGEGEESLYNNLCPSTFVCGSCRHIAWNNVFSRAKLARYLRCAALGLACIGVG